MAEHNELGKKGEELARQHLASKSYKILATNWRSGRNEVDLIVSKDKYLVLVEVKTRDTDFFGHPSSFVSRKQQNSMAEVAEAYLEANPELKLEVRYDVVSVILNKNKTEIEHFEDVFWPDNLGLFSADF